MHQPSIVIVMDDLGNNLELGRRAIELPGSLTYAILPHTPLAKKLAFYTTRFDGNKEVIIHMPMQANSPRRLGPGALELSQDKASFVDTIRDAVNAIPYARGLSNHMGSGLTTSPDRMNWLMTELARHNFYFIDSRTTSMSTAAFVANQQAIPHLARDVFLDHDTSPVAIDRAFRHSLSLARQNGLAVVIAHPYEETLNYLEQALPTLHKQGISLVTASEAIERKTKMTGLLLPQGNKLAANTLPDKSNR